MIGVFEVLEKFNLDQIGDDWIKARNLDSSGSNVPQHYEDFLEKHDLSALLDEANHTVKPFVMNYERYNLSWDQLVENKARPKALVCFVRHIVTKAVVSNFPEDHFIEGLKASQFYFLVLAIPNSNVFCVFSSDVYNKCLQLINLASTVELVPGEIAGGQFHSNVNSLSKLMLASIKALSLVLKPGNLSLSEECIDATVLTLSELTRLKHCNTSSTSQNTSFSSIAFDMLKSLCCANQRNVESTVCCILQRLFPTFLLGICQNTNLSNKDVSTLQSQTIVFISQLILIVPKNSFIHFVLLLKKMCTISTERNDCRQKICDFAIRLLRCYPSDAVSDFLIFILKLTYDESAGNRVFGIELIGFLLHENIFERCNENASFHSSFESEHAGISIAIPHYYLLYALFSRVSDVAGIVRCRALAVLANCLKSHNQNLQRAINDIFVVPFLSEEQPPEDEFFVFMDFRDFLKKLDLSPSSISLESLLGAKAVMETLTERCLDSRVYVRRSALQVLSRIILLGRHWINDEILAVLGCHCRDTATSVRKSAAEYLTEIVLEYPDEMLVVDAWVQNIFPLVEDNETRVSEKALESMEQVILKNLVEFGRMNSADRELPWRVINALGRLQVRKFFSKACQIWGEKSVFKNYCLVRIFTSHIGTENNMATWSMMASVADYLSIKDAEHFLEYFYHNIYKNPAADHRLSQLVIEVIAVSCNALSPNVQEKLLTELESEMLSFALPVSILPKCVEIMQTLSIANNRDGSANDGQTCMSPPWAVRIAQVSEKFIESSLLSHEPVIVNEELFVRAVIALGEMSLLAPNTVKSDVTKQLRRVIDPVSDHVPESSAKVKAGIVVTLGKMSLQCERLAKSMVSVLGRLLTSTDNSNIKSNVMIALADLTIRYTALVEDLLPEMCLCLKDPVRLVRENTLVLITRLIQEDYLKMRSCLLFHLLSALTDNDETIRAMTSSFFVDSALVKHKHLFQNHLLECLFYFNGYLNNEHCQITVSDRERIAFSLQGNRNRQNRETIYRFMLSQMDIQQRFKSQRLIVDSICGAAVEETLKLDCFGEDVLRDALFCLLADENRIIPTAGENDDDILADVDDAAHEALHMAKKKFISEVVRGYVIGSEVPIIANLQQKLSEMKSPLARDVIKFLHFQVQEYEADIGEIFKNDPDLAKKVVADLLRYENENRMFVSDCEGESSLMSSFSHCSDDVTVDLVRLNEDRPREQRSSKSGKTPQKPPRGKTSEQFDSSQSSMFSDRSSSTGISVLSSEVLRAKRKSGRRLSGKRSIFHISSPSK